MAKGFKIEGMKELEKAIKKLGQVPQKAVTPAARKAMNIAIKDARVKAPVDTGELKQGMKLIGEKAKSKGKKVYRIVFDRAKNDIFQKKHKVGTNNKVLKKKRGKIKAGAETTGYYPISQEYGFFARNGRYIPGFHFVEKGLTENANKIEKTIVDEMGKRIDKAMKG
jgi:uncharacterized protein YabN with tetrapyrrole methylase and pyrophosphatase domain